MKFHLCLITVSSLLGLLVADGNSNRGKKEKRNDTQHFVRNADYWDGWLTVYRDIILLLVTDVPPKK